MICWMDHSSKKRETQKKQKGKKERKQKRTMELNAASFAVVPSGQNNILWNQVVAVVAVAVVVVNEVAMN